MADPFEQTQAQKSSGKMLGPYEIIEKIGEGGMGKVFKAYHPELGKPVAIKVMHDSDKVSEKEKKRFLAEAQNTAQLRHPNIVMVYNAGHDEGKDYIVMDFIAGETLSHVLKRRELSAKKALELMKEIALAIDYAHQQNIIHRDLKPENVMIETATGRPIIMDFGLAKNVKRSKGLTKSGEVFGTPQYMAPEQAYGNVREISPRTDVYALGAMLYEMLTGMPAVKGDTPVNIMLNIINDEVIPLRRRNPKIHADVETICLKALEKEPKHRYPSAAAFAEDIGRYLNGESISARPSGFWHRTWKRVRRNKPIAAIFILSLLFMCASGWVWMKGKQEQATAQEKTLSTVAAARKDARKYLYLGWEYQNKNMPEKALAAFTQAIMLDPACAEAYNNRGAIRRTQGDTEGALADFGKAIEFNPHFAESYVNRGDTWQKNGNWSKAMADFSKAIECNPHLLEIYTIRGTLRHNQQDTAGAVADFTKAIEINPQSAKAYNGLGICLLAQKDTAGALANLNKAIEIDPRYTQAYTNRGVVRHKQGDIDGALADFSQAIHLDPKCRQAYINRSDILYGKGDTKGVMADLDKLLELDPGCAELHDKRGFIRYSTGDFSGALADFDKTIELDPNFALAYKNRALTLAKKGDRAAAVANFRKYLKFNLDDPDTQQIHDYIRKHGALVPKNE